MDRHTFVEFQSQLTGEVVLPESPEYDDLRNVFNQTGNPAVIVRPKNTDEIAGAIRFAQDNQLKLSVRSGGHGATGLSTNDGGLVIDLSHFNSVEVLDPAQRLVRIGTGAKWGDVAQALAPHGLAISSGDTNSVGVGGLTLGGGIGWMVRKYGLTIDSLEAAEIVTADGRTLRVSANEHPDLFWAIRGGGGNFGVVTYFDFRAQPVQTVVGGLVTFDIAEAESILPKWIEYMRTAPEELNSTIALFSGFGPEVPPGLFMYVCYGGDDEAVANAAIQPLLELGTVREQDIQKKPYYQMLEDAQLPPGFRVLSTTGFIKTLNQDVIDALTANYGRPGAPIVQIRSLGGAMSRVNPEATAFAHRNYEVFILAGKPVPVTTAPEEMERIRKEAWRPIEKFVEGAYINFQSDAGESSINAAYPPATYARLARVKAAYDPNNLFNQNHNIKPAVSNGSVQP